MPRYFVFALLIFVLSGCGEAPPKAAPAIAYSEEEIEAATARARREVETFISEMSKTTSSGFAVKAPVEDGSTTEHVWLGDITYKNGEFQGIINKDPEKVSNVRKGQKLAVRKNEISDWMFLKNGKLYGNYTVRPTLKSMPEEESFKLRSMLADP